MPPLLFENIHYQIGDNRQVSTVNCWSCVKLLPGCSEELKLVEWRPR